MKQSMRIGGLLGSAWNQPEYRGTSTTATAPRQYRRIATLEGRRSPPPARAFSTARKIKNYRRRATLILCKPCLPQGATRSGSNVRPQEGSLGVVKKERRIANSACLVTARTQWEACGCCEWRSEPRQSNIRLTPGQAGPMPRELRADVCNQRFQFFMSS